MGYKSWFLRHLLREKKLLILVLTFLIIFIGTTSITPLFIGDVFSELEKSNASFHNIIWTALLIAIAGIVRAVSAFTQSYVNEVLTHKVTKNVTEELYSSILEKSHAFYDQVKIGE